MKMWKHKFNFTNTAPKIKLKECADKEHAISQLKKEPRLPSLDGLRGVAILFVLWAHITPKSQQSDPSLFERALAFSPGRLGITIFFVISGFLITHLLLKERDAHGKIDIKSFYFRRALRILPVSILYIFFIWCMNDKLGLNIPGTMFLYASTYTMNFSPSLEGWFLSHFWSLGVEEQFYFFWPVVVGLGASRGMKIGFFIILYSILCRFLLQLWPETRLWCGGPFFKHADSLVIGGMLAFIRNLKGQSFLWKFDILKRKIVWLGAFFGMLAFSWLGAHPSLLGVASELIAPFMVSVCIAILLARALTVRTGALFFFLNHPITAYIGVLSYSLYVWQQFFIHNDLPAGINILIPEIPRILNLPLLFFAAMISYHCFEKKFLNIKKKFKKI